MLKQQWAITQRAYRQVEAAVPNDALQQVTTCVIALHKVVHG